MDNKTIFTKTAKGVGEAVGKTRALPRDLRNVLKEIDGIANVEELLDKIGNLSEPKLRDALTKLASGDYIRKFAQPKLGEHTRALGLATIFRPRRNAAKPAQKAAEAPPAEIPASAQADAAQYPNTEMRTKKDLDEWMRLKAEEQARIDAENRARREADERKRIAEEERIQKDLQEWASHNVADLESEEEKTRRAAEAQAQKEAQEKIRRVAEAQARQEAEQRLRAEQEQAERQEREARAKQEEEAKQQALRDAAAKAKLEAEAREQARRSAEQALREAEEKERARQEAEELARREAEILAMKAAQEQLRRDAEERLRKEAERQAKQDAEEKARLEAEALAAKEAEEQARRAAQEQALREKAEQFKREAEERAKQEAEQKARQEAEQRAQREAEALRQQQAAARREQQAKKEQEQARLQAEENARREMEQREQQEQRVRKEAEEKAARDAEERLQKESAERMQQEEENALRELAQQAQMQEQDNARQEKKQANKTADAAGENARDNARRMLEHARRQIEETRSKVHAQLADSQAKNEAEEARRMVEEARREMLAQKGEAHGAHDSQRNPPHAADTDDRSADGTFDAMHADTAEDAGWPDADKSAATDVMPDSDYRGVYRKPVKWGRLVASALVLSLAVGLGLLHTMSFDDRIAAFEKAGTEQLHKPVKIRQLHLSLFPRPHWNLEGVSIGNDNEIRAPKVELAGGLGSLFNGDMTFDSIDIMSPVVKEAGLDWLLFERLQGHGIKVGRLVATNGRLDSPVFRLTAFNASAIPDANGNWKSMLIDAAENNLNIQLQPKGDAMQIDMTADTFAVPFGSTLNLERFNASGIARRNELTVTQFGGNIHDGIVGGTAALKRNAAGWMLNGEWKAVQLDMTKLAPQLFGTGKLDGNGLYTAAAPDIGNLLAEPRVEGNVVVRGGTLLGVDLATLFRNGNAGGKSPFNEMTSTVFGEKGKLQLRRINLTAGLLSVNGNVDVDANSNLSGHFIAELKTPTMTMQSRAGLALSGTASQPHFSR